MHLRILRFISDIGHWKLSNDDLFEPNNFTWPLANHPTRCSKKNELELMIQMLDD